MSTTTTTTFTALGGKLVVDDDLKASQSSDNATAATSGKIYICQIDNSSNSSSCFLKIIDASSASPSNTSANGSGTPHIMLYAPAAKSISYVFPEGHTFSAGLSMWCCELAAVGNVDAASSAVIVTIVSS